MEFPFVCSLKLGEKVIKVVCAQVPPFFCLMPANLHHKVILEPHLTDIMHSVNEALEEKLMEYYAEVCVNYAKDVAAGKRRRARGKNFIDWFKNFLPSTEPSKIVAKARTKGIELKDGPLLVFSYLDPYKEFEINVLQRARCT